MRARSVSISGCLLACLLAAIAPARASEVDQFESFRRVASLGLESALLALFANDSILAAVDSLPEGTSLRIDPIEDGQETIFAWREGRTRVAIVGGGDRPSSPPARGEAAVGCYLVDLHGDGVLDRVIDYVDDDRDGDPDRMDLYEITPGGIGADGIGVTVVFDLDDDNRLLALTDYDYHANRDMWRSDFSGSACLVAGIRDEVSGRWTSVFENPFCFYDDDNDGLTDEALRFEGTDLAIRSMRWSFDADGDATEESPHDFDFSLNAVGQIRAPESFAHELPMRDGGILRFVAWDKARDLARWGLWRSALLVWDEVDRNVAPESEVPTRERWEGVIAEPFMGVPQIGGPACGRANKRYEIDADNSGRLGLYFSEVDRRIHLLGAERGEITVALAGDPGIRRTITMTDADGNGYFDAWTWAAESTPRRERAVILRNEAPRRLPTGTPAMREAWRDRLGEARKQARWDLDQLGGSGIAGARGHVRRWWTEARDRGEPIAVAAEKSLETERYLYDLSLWDLGGGFLALDPAEGKPSAAWSPEQAIVPGTALVLDVGAIPEKKRKALDLLSNVELTFPGGRVAGQPEDWDADGLPDAIYFPALEAAPHAEASRVTIEIDPAHPLPWSEEIRVDPHFGASIAFESLPIAYRAYEGRIDFLAKRRPALILRGDLGDHHTRRPWGMDPFDVGGGPGLGGLFVEDASGWHPLFGQGAYRSQRVVASGPARAVIESVVEAAGVRATRRWSLTPGDHAIVEDLLIDLSQGVDSVRIAAAIPSLSENGYFRVPTGIWSYGESIVEAGAIGLAGCALDDRDALMSRVGGHVALVFRCGSMETIRLAWMAGAVSHGDSTADAWRMRSERVLSGHKDRPVSRAIR